MKYYAGLDISDATTAICIEDENGQIVLETQVATTPAKIARALSAFKLEIVGLESGTLCHWLTRKLRSYGQPAECIDARLMKAILATKKNKNDRNDARGIASAMRAQHYRPVHIKSNQALEIKTLIRSRACLKKEKTLISNTIKGLLKTNGIFLKSGSAATLGDRVQTALAEENPIIQSSMEALLHTYTCILTQIQLLDLTIRQLAKECPRATLLMTIPGIGPITALCYLAEIDDPSRFAKPHDVGAYLGLTPRQYQSGTTNRSGPISKQGPPHLRYLLYESAIVLLTRTSSWSQLKAWGIHLSRRKNFKLAATAVARKLSVIMHCMLSRNEPFRYSDKPKAEKAA